MAGAAGTLTRSGTFVWEELMTSDVDAAREFYGPIFGWQFEEDQMPGGSGRYVMFGPGEPQIGGMYTKQGMPSAWLTYIGVDSADEAAAKATELGASVLMGPFDVGEFGRMAVIQDPTGAVVQVWQSIGEEITAPKAVHGTVAWRELRTTDVDAALKFYVEWLGWSIDSHDLETMQYHVAMNGDEGVCGMMQIGPDWGEVPSHWAVTFLVDDVDATFAAATDAGAQVQMPPDDLPEVGRFAALADPQGVSFGIMRWSEQR